MASFDEDTINVQGLERLVKTLKVKPPTCRIGILGENPRKKTEGEKHAPTNAEIGAYHELGIGQEQRSFLRVPIADGLEKEMIGSQLLDEKTLKKVIKDKSIKPWMEQVAICAEACVSMAFDSGGSGKWPAWKTPGYENNTGMILVDSQQLRNAVTSEVKD